MLSLHEIQQRFLAAIAGDGAAEAGLVGIIHSRGGLSTAMRVSIYADMYRTRLLDALREDFPRLRAIVGDTAFAAAAGRYFASRPSTHPSLRYLGEGFADHLGTESLPRPFLPDLARLEWARVEVFDAADPEPLRLADLAALPAAEWPALRLRPIAACRLVTAAWPVHEIWSAAGEGRADVEFAALPSTIRVWREGWEVSHAAMGQTEQDAFRLLQQGAPFATLCAAVEVGRDTEAAAREAGALLMRWLEDGLLARPQA
jgi:hypothetical protein